MPVMSCRYHRLPLPVEGAPLEEHFDAFVNVLRVSSVLIFALQTLCNLSTSIFNASNFSMQETPSLCVNGGGACPPPALLFSCQVGVGRTNVAMIMGTLVMDRVMENTQPSPATHTL